MYPRRKMLRRTIPSRMTKMKMMKRLLTTFSLILFYQQIPIQKKKRKKHEEILFVLCVGVFGFMNTFHGPLAPFNHIKINVINLPWPPSSIPTTTINSNITLRIMCVCARANKRFRL